MRKAMVSTVIMAVLFVLCGCEKESVVNRYFVSFNTNGGTAVKQQVIIEGEKVSIPLEPTKKGYAFAGWYLNDELYDFDKPVISDMTLNATWNEIIEICDKICKTGYKLDSKCNCVKEENTTKTTTTKKKASGNVKRLILSETDVTLIEGQDRKSVV